jgi:hypothetical protein
VKFRNIWVREIKPPTGRRVSAPFNLEQKKKKEEPKPEEKPETKPVPAAEEKK